MGDPVSAALKCAATVNTMLNKIGRFQKKVHKGQIISKRLFDVFNSSKNERKQFEIVVYLYRNDSILLNLPRY